MLKPKIRSSVKGLQMLRLEGKTIQIIIILNYNMIEIWRDVIGYEGLYEVSNFGRVRSLEYKGKKREVPLIIGGYKTKNGYLRIALSKNKKNKKIFIHRLVVEAFILGRKMIDGEFCDHLNTIRTDNRLENLRVCSRKENNNNPLTRKRHRESMNNPLTRKKISESQKGNSYANKQLDLMEIQFPHREFTFRNSCEASRFFDYKNETTIGTCISKARKKGSNIINIKGREYFFAQQKKGEKANV